MSIYEIVIGAYPELENSRYLVDGTIEIRNDSDGEGDYINTWDYSKPLPEGLKVGK